MALGRAEPQADIRFILKRMLLDPAVQQRYDMVVIDLPPRNSLLSYNALCAATDLLMVTKPDAMSTDSIVRFANYLERQRALLFPDLRICGLAGVMVNRQTTGWRTPLSEAATQSSVVWGGRPETIPLLPEVPDRVAVARASGTEFVALSNKDMYAVFAKLADSLHLFDDERTSAQTVAV